MIDDEEYNIKFNSERVQTQYWIDRNGTIHRYKGLLEESITSMHYQIAHSFFPNETYPEDHCMKKGWVKMGSVVYVIPIMHKEPNQRQIDTLYDLGQLDRLHIEDNGIYRKWEII